MSNRPDFPVPLQRADYQPAWPQEEFIVPLLRQKIEAAFAAHATPAPTNGKALDVGCGGQPFRSRLEAIGYAYTGLDVQQNQSGTVDLICSLDEPLPFGPDAIGRFNFILCTEVLEHIADWQAAFANLFRLAAPQARVLITCPQFYQLHEEPYDYWRPTLHALRYFAVHSGFRVLQDEKAGDAWDVLGTLLGNCSARAVGHSLIDRALAKLTRVGREWLFATLRNRRLQTHVRLQGPLYLSNIIVLEKPA